MTGSTSYDFNTSNVLYQKECSNCILISIILNNHVLNLRNRKLRRVRERREEMRKKL
jgi:hypothetical protein